MKLNAFYAKPISSQAATRPQQANFSAGTRNTQTTPQQKSPIRFGMSAAIIVGCFVVPISGAITALSLLLINRSRRRIPEVQDHQHWYGAQYPNPTYPQQPIDLEAAPLPYRDY